MSFFQKEETEKNLQYDDIAFLHFLLTVSLVALVFFGYFVYKRFQSASVKSIKNYNRLKSSGLYTKQIQNQSAELKKKHLTTGFWVMLGFFITSIVIVSGLIFFISTHSTQMIGFDPHQILGIPQDATVTQIKKAYRKLALEFHPDRNPNNPQAHAKFIMISKSYECLTDEQKRQNCLKFGNPDGQASFQVGIGLPKFLISKENQFIILPIVFALLLVVVPMIFINWTNNLKSKQKVGLDIANYPLIHQFFEPNFNPGYGFYLLTVLKELQTDKKLQEKQKAQLIQQLKEKGFINVDFLTKNCSQGQYYVLHKIYRQLAYKECDPELCKKIPDLLNALMHFSCYYARKMNHEKFLIPNALPITWIGTKHMHMLLAFLRLYYNGSLFYGPQLKSFDYLDMTKEDREISLKYPVPNLYELITNEQKKKQHVAVFPEHHRDYIEKQLNDVPQINLDLKIMIGDKASFEFSTEDYAQIFYKVERKNSPTGYYYAPHFPYLKEERFYLMIVYQGNLVYFQEVMFQEGKDKVVGKFPYRQSFARKMQFFAFLLSDCRNGIDFQTQLHFIVKQPSEQEVASGIEFNKEDLELEKLPKNGFEKALSMEIENPSDNELSSDEQEGKQDTRDYEVKNGKKYMRMEKETGGCHDCDHDH